MAQVKVTIHTRRAIGQAGVPSIIKRVQSNSNRAAYNFAQNVEGGAKRRVHVITGRLRNSIVRHRTGPGSHRIIVGMHYGVYEEYGTRYRPPHPFFRPAVASAKAKFEREMKQVFSR